MNEKRFYELFPISGKKVLEIGCGSDHAFTSLLMLRNDVVPTDVIKVNIRGFISANIYNLPFKDGSFDVVFAGNILHHLTDMDRAVKEIKRVLKPKGKFLGEEPNGKWLYIFILLVKISKKFDRNMVPEEHPVYPDGIKALFNRNGFHTYTEAIADRLPILRDYIPFLKSCFIIRAVKR